MCLAQRDWRWVSKPKLAVQSLVEQLAIMSLPKRDESWLGQASEPAHGDGGMSVNLV